MVSNGLDGSDLQAQPQYLRTLYRLDLRHMIDANRCLRGSLYR
jgi:hypothetical protein